MLSIYTLKSAGEASKYYQQGDYYAHESSESTQSHSQWLGKADEHWGLQGPVAFDTFKTLLQGHLPSGEEMIQVKKGGHHRPGYDFTFSAPKSVSILALVAGNTEVLKAHQEAVQETLLKMENQYAACRNKKNGTITLEKTGNFLIAAFEHRDSRAGDPNLHTHSVLINMTQRKDGAWRTLFSDELYNDKLLNGMEYRSALAQKLMQLGYELNLKEKGTFEIAAVPESILNAFSKRRQQIEHWLEEKNLTGGEAAIVANFQTRSRKVSTAEEHLKLRWERELEAAGSNLNTLRQISENAKTRGPVALPDPYIIAELAVQDALEHLSERKTTFTISEIMKSAKQFSIVPSSDGDFLNIIEQKITDKALVFMEGKQLTTPQTLQIESQTIHSMLSGKKTVNAMLSPWIANFVSKSKLKTEDQQIAIKQMLTNRDQQMLVSSDSNAMLMGVLNVFHEVCTDQRYYTRLLTQRKINIEGLIKKTGFERVHTLEGFLLSCEQRAEKQPAPPNRFMERLQDWSQRVAKREAREIWVMEGELSSQQLKDLQHWSQYFGSRLILTQTKNRVCSAISNLKDKGISNVHISTHKSYREDPTQQISILNNINDLEKNYAIQIIGDSELRLKTAADNFALGDLLLVTNNHHRFKLNELARDKLKNQGYLSKEKIMMDTLQPIYLSNQEKKHAHLYNLGDVLRFNRGKTNSLITKDSYFVIKNVNLKANLIELHNANNDQVFWDPSKGNPQGVEVFRTEKREIAVGDRLVWTRTLKADTGSLLLLKNQMVNVSAINSDSLSVSVLNGKTINLDLKNPKHQHFDYGYAVLLKNAETTHFDKITLFLQSQALDQKTIQDLNGILNNASEHFKNIKIFCDDIEKCKKVIAKEISEPSLQTVPYLRKEALSEHQTTVTQPIFHGLQAAYLQARQLNPEFLEKNAPKTQENHRYSPEFKMACNAVDYVVLHHSERESLISLKTLKKETYELAGVYVPTPVIDGAIECAVARGWLVKVPNMEPSHDGNDIRVCARHTLLMEKLCIQKMKEGQNQLNPIVSRDDLCLQEVQQHSRLTQGQKDAITLILTTQDRMVAIQGVAGAGKTTALREINKHCQTQGINPLVLANTGSARNQAQQASGIPSMTVAQFLTRVDSLLNTDKDKATHEFGGNRLIILDEFSLISTKDMFKLLGIVDKLNTRLTIMGDIKQIGSIGTGEIARNLLAYGVSRAAMVENVRLKDSTAFEAMKQAYAGDMAKTLQTLRDSIEEMPVKSEALSRIVDIYTSFNPGRREQTLIITPLNEDRNFINHAIRDKLKEKGELEGVSLKTNMFMPSDRHEIEKTTISSFRIGDHVRFNSHYPRIGIKAGEYREVCEVDVKHHRLTLKNGQDDRIYWSVQSLKKSSDIEIYRQEAREFMKNDTVILKRNDEALGIYNGDKAQILEIKETLLTLSLATGKTVALDLNKPEHQHLDYGYALTAYAGQGRDVDFVLAYGDGPKSFRKKESDLKIGDTIVLPKEMQPKGAYETYSKLVSVQSLKQNKLILKDSEGQIQTLDAVKERVWDAFPPFEARKEKELPLSTTQKSFLVQITRGDNLCLIVPNIFDFQKTLEKHKGDEGSALRHFDPKCNSLNQAVERMVENIRGKAEQSSEDRSATQAIPSMLTDGVRGDIKIKEPKLKKRETSKFKDHWQKLDSSEPRIKVDELELRLANDPLGYASRWLGQPSSVRGREARWGTKGSFSLTLAGSKTGFWYNHEIGKGGKGLVSLYREIYNLEWREAIQALAKDCGLQNENRPNISLPTKSLTQENKDRKQKIDYAQKEYAKGVPIKGTVAEKYLRDERGILGELPTDFRYRANGVHLNTEKPTPSLIAPYRDKDNAIIGFVRIFLGPNGTRYKETFIDKTGKTITATRKANVGLSSKGAVIAQKGIQENTLWVAEGIETALSVSRAIPNQTVVASLSAAQLKNVPIATTVQQVTICADLDPAGSNTKKSVVDAVAFHLSEGRRVWIAMPLEIPAGMKKADFNDLLKQGGISSVQNALEQRVEIKNIKALRVDEPSLSVILEKIREGPKNIEAKGPEKAQPLRNMNRELER